MNRRILIVVVVLAGLTMSVPAGAIVGGQNASPGEYPWMAAVYRGDPSAPYGNIRGQFCGGSLVAPTVVVSAAHCIDVLTDGLLGAAPVDPLGLGVSVLIGETRLNGTGGERIRVRSFHEYQHNDSDIAVLVLWEASTMTPIRWATPDDAALYEPGAMATVTGWGATRETGGYPNDLKEASVPIVSDESCSASYPGQINPLTMVCAGYPQGGIDTCGGDSGGPIMVPGEDDTLVLIGTTWFGNGCARPNAPGVYAETAPAHSFILGHTI